MENRLQQIKSYCKNFIGEFRSLFLKIPEKYKKDIPYFAQYESTDSVEKIIEKKISAKDDPKWNESGAKTKEEYVLWSWSMCGMACLKMILKFKENKIYKTIELGHECEKFGGYIEKKDDIDGLFFYPFQKFLIEKFGWNSEVCNFLSVSRIKAELAKENFVIASVHFSIRNPELVPKYKGGHLVLMTGFDNKKKTLFLNNPTGFHEKSQKDFEISEKDFKKFFAGRGIIIN